MFCDGESNQAKRWIAVRLGDRLLQCPTNLLPSIRQACSIPPLSGRVIFLKTLKAMLARLCGISGGAALAVCHFMGTFGVG